MKNIEIITYDELYERAKFIVEHNNDQKETRALEINMSDKEDLPF